MAALIGLFAGALIGHLLWQDWGAALGGIAGFFAGVRFAAWRAPPGAGRSGIAPRSPAAPMQQRVGSAQPGQDPTWARRVEELERRVASLEREANVHLDAAVTGPYPKEAAGTVSGARSGDRGTGGNRSAPRSTDSDGASSNGARAELPARPPFAHRRRRRARIRCGHGLPAVTR